MSVPALGAGAQQGSTPAPASKTQAITTYQIEAITTSGLGALAAGGGADLMRMMLGGRPKVDTATHTLELQLESPRVVTDPSAEHRIPAGLGMGAALPLRSINLEKGERPTGREDDLVEGKGRMLLFRGCAESAAADQPEIVSLQGWTAEQKQQALAAMKALAARGQAVDAPGTSGRWPAGSETQTVPLQGSLVGSHTVVSTYAPEIRFQVDSSHDFLAPVQLSSAAGQGGAQNLRWQVVPTALGYQASAVGPGQQEGDLVVWTSSEAPRNDNAVPSDLRSAEAVRLIQRKVLLPPEHTACTMSAQAMAALQGGAIVTLTAYGDTLTVSSAAGQPSWQLRLERRSTATRLVGEGMEMFESGGASGGEAEPPRGRGFNPFRLF